LKHGAFICTCTATDRSGSDHTNLGIPLIPGDNRRHGPHRHFSLPMHVPRFASPFYVLAACPQPFRLFRGSQAHPKPRLQWSQPCRIFALCPLDFQQIRLPVHLESSLPCASSSCRRWKELNAIANVDGVANPLLGVSRCAAVTTNWSAF
jgi:hypothetical protein